MVGAAGFEPATSCSQSRRANRAALRPEGEWVCGRQDVRPLRERLRVGRESITSGAGFSNGGGGAITRSRRGNSRGLRGVYVSSGASPCIWQ